MPGADGRAPMIVFVTLLLGLVTGNQLVEVAVSGKVAAVELWLDGELVSRLEGEPWRAEVDFGAALTTHELLAIGRGAGGEELGRVAQQINVPRSPIEAELLLDGWRGGRPGFARLIWRSASLEVPRSIEVSLDGSPVAAPDPERIRLPDLDPEQMHFISVELTFAGNHRVTTQAVFGGRYGEAVESELTAVPVRPAGGRLAGPREASGWLRRPSGEPLPVVAVEQDAGEVVVVRDELALRSLQRLHRDLQRERPRSYRRIGLIPEDRVYLMSARAVVASHPELDYELYPMSRPFGIEEFSLPRALAELGMVDEARTRQRLSEAVAVAGVRAAAGGRRRAVLLVVSDCGARSGRWSGEQVRRYLAELRVPLEVWTTRRPDPGGGGFCRGARQLIGSASYQRAVTRLRRLLETQQVLWVAGSYLPREIVLAAEAPASEVVDRSEERTPPPGAS